MESRLTIKNFRIFDENGATFEFNPITILTGCNSSGKSSIVKALLLLQDFCQQLRADYAEGKQLRLENYKMDFHKEPNSILGAFNLVRHHKNIFNTDQSESDNCISMEFQVKSYWLLQDVILHLEFGSLQQDELNDGYLQAYSIRTLDGTIIYKADRNGSASMDFSKVKRPLLHFLYGQYAFSQLQKEYNSEDVVLNLFPPREEVIAGFKDFCSNTIKNLGNQAFMSILEWQVSHCEQTWQKDFHSYAKPIITDSIESSFIKNSPDLNVYCYFPCLEQFKDMDKNHIIALIKEKLESNKSEKLLVGDLIDSPYLPKGERIICDFLDLFEKSDAKSLHEFLSEKEDQVLFVNCHIVLHEPTDNKFVFPKQFCYLNQGESIHDRLRYDETWNKTLYGLLVIDELIADSDKQYAVFNESNEAISHLMESSLYVFFRNIIEDIFVQVVIGQLSYSPTTIVKPQRLYSLEDNSDFSNTLKSFLEIKRVFSASKENASSVYYDKWGDVVLLNNPSQSFRFKRNIYPEKYEPGTFINKWLNELNIAGHMEIKTHADGYGATIRLFEDENDTNGMLLADKGLGITQIFMTLLKIEIAIIESQKNELINPLFTEGLNEELFEFLKTYNQLHPITVALEEPESHLHPNYQSLLADMFLEAYQAYNIHFIIETHSEYLVRRCQVITAIKNKKSASTKKEWENPFKVYYFPTDGYPYDMEFAKDGYFEKPFGKGFFNVSSELSLDLDRIEHGIYDERQN